MTIDRDNFIEILTQYKPSKFEQEAVSELLDFVKNKPTCFERIKEENAKHIAAAVLLVNPKNEALFLWHTKIQQWTQPGGHCDGNANILEVALTELQEETGIKNAKINPVPLEIRKYSYDKNVFGYSKNIYNITYLAEINNDEKAQICEPDKCEKMAWMKPLGARQELANSHYPNAEHLIDKWEQRI